MQLDFQIGKKKDVYPSKKSINLYYGDENATKWTTIALDVLLVAVLILGLAKVLVFDLLSEHDAALAKVENAQVQLAMQNATLEDFDEVSEEYARYSYGILVDALKLHDRMEVLEMLENTVFADSGITSISISGNVISLGVSGMNLDATAQLIEKIQSYSIVESVQINNQNGSGGTYNGSMVIVLTDLQAAGGEQ